MSVVNGTIARPFISLWLFGRKQNLFEPEYITVIITTTIDTRILPVLQMITASD